MQVTEHTDRTFALYQMGNIDGTISLFRKMSRIEAEYSVLHNSLQGGGTKWISESYIKAASFTNQGVQGAQRVVEYRITKIGWAVMRAASRAQGQQNTYGIQYHHEGIYLANSTQGGPFRNYGISNNRVAWFNQQIKDVRFAPSVDYRYTLV